MLNIKKVRKSAFIGLIVAGASLSGVAAATANFSVDPTNWRVQNYGGTTITLWLTPTPCSNGQLNLDPTDTADRNRLLFAAVMAAKAAKQKIYIEYDIATNNSACIIRSFAVDGPVS